MTVKSLKQILENIDDSKKVYIGNTWQLAEGDAYEIHEDFDTHIVKNKIIFVVKGEEKEMIYKMTTK